jgi:hypothetical protein
MVSNDLISDYMRRHDCSFPEALEALAAQLNRVLFEKHSFWRPASYLLDRLNYPLCCALTMRDEGQTPAFCAHRDGP